MRSIVTTEVKAAILRHRLFDRLTDRTDIIAAHNLAPGLAHRIAKFIVAGLDDGRHPGTGGWPVPTGGRYAKLCFSPALADIEVDDASDRPYRLPVTAYHFVSYVQEITGLGPDEADDLGRIFRFDPAELFDICYEMRTSCPAAWRLLLSNEFALAKRLWPALAIVPPKSQFRYPLVNAFQAIAEFERASLIMRHLARARLIVDRPKFLEYLASPLPLSDWFKPDQLIEVYRWIEYVSFSSAALSELLFNRDVEQVRALPAGYAPWAIARGEIAGSAQDFHNHPEVRKELVHVFTKPAQTVTTQKNNNEVGLDESGDPSVEKPPVERKKSYLRNDDIFRWYGVNSEVMPIIALDDVRHRFPTRRVRNFGGVRRRQHVGDESRPVLMRLGSAIRKRADRTMQLKVLCASRRYGTGSRQVARRDRTLEGNTKLGLKLALLYLPSLDALGGAARFDPLAWENPLRDADFWRMLLNPRRSSAWRGMTHPVRTKLRSANKVMRRVYGEVLAGSDWSDEVERVICDLAIGLSPISTDPHIRFALHALERKPQLKGQLKLPAKRKGYRIR